MENPKYIFVVGGVMSGIGKGVASSAIGRILKSKGFKTTAIKIDPYINVDAGTMNPTEHGEVFVLSDGYECDQDMGNYERFLGETLPSINYMTTGRVYQEVIRKERNLEYKGKNVEVVPDIPLEVIRRISEAQKTAGAEVTLVEVGGTIGEMQTKPTQYASRSLNSVGLQADIILARATMPLDEKRKEKIATFCNILPERVISAPDVESIYDVPLNYEKDGMGDILCEVLGLPPRKTDLSEWEGFVKKVKNGSTTVNIAVVGKYFDSGEFVLADSYISVLEALKHASAHQDLNLKISYLSSKEFESGELPLGELKKYNGILIPGGFGETGIEGKIKVIEYARINKIPYFGLCYGMQLMCIEYARNVAGLAGANTAEIDSNAAHTVIDFMPEQKEKIAKGEYGGTMRLGPYPCVLKDNTIALEPHDAADIEERHRHRYEVNPSYIQKLTDAGLVFSCTSPDGRLMEIAELPKEKHPFMLGTQFHPEFLSRPLSPHPLFKAFIKAAGEKK